MIGSAPRSRVPVSSAGVSCEEIMVREGAHLVDPADKHEDHPEEQDRTEEGEHERAGPRSSCADALCRRWHQDFRERGRRREVAVLRELDRDRR